MTTIARNLMRRSLFPGHPYGLRNNGTPESIGKLGQEDLAAFWKKYVVAKNGVIAVFGNVKAAEVKAMVEKAFAEMPAGDASSCTLEIDAPCVSVTRPTMRPVDCARAHTAGTIAMATVRAARVMMNRNMVQSPGR